MTTATINTTPPIMTGVRMGALNIRAPMPIPIAGSSTITMFKENRLTCRKPYLLDGRAISVCTGLAFMYQIE